MANIIFDNMTLDQLRERARLNIERGIRMSPELKAEIRKREDESCTECGGSGKLTRLGGDWGKTPNTETACWMCEGTGARR